MRILNESICVKRRKEKISSRYFSRLNVSSYPVMKKRKQLMAKTYLIINDAFRKCYMLAACPIRIQHLNNNIGTFRRSGFNNHSQMNLLAIQNVAKLYESNNTTGI